LIFYLTKIFQFFLGPNLQDGRKQQGDLMGEPDKKKAKSSHNPILSPRFLSTSQMLSPNSRSL